MDSPQPRDLLDPSIRELILFALACKAQDSMTIKYHFFEAQKLDCTMEQLNAVVEMMKKQKVKFRREIELTFKQLFMV